MVLCASNADHSVVKFVEPPAGAPAGARIGFAGKEGQPATPSQVQKKKILEKLSPLLRTDSAGVPGFNGAAFTVGEFGSCTSELPDATVG
jgi:aminoacyl tRNA synthase complex-interacting multifunctional protein 1